MALTISNLTNSNIGSKRMQMCDVTFDSSYITGGESFAAGDVRLSKIDRVIIEGKDGYVFDYDHTNEKIRVYAPAPPVVFEEYVTVSSNVGYLKWPAAHIDYVAGHTGSAYVLEIPIAGGVTPAQGQVAVDLGYNDTTGVLTKGSRTSLTFNATDAITHCWVSYVTQAWKEVTDNMSMAKMTSGAETYGDGLTFTAGTPDCVKLGTDIVAMTSITWSDGGDAGTIKVPELLKDGGTPAATLETEIDFVKATTYAEVNHFATDAVDTTGDIVRYVYIKDPGTGTFLNERFTNAEITDSSDTHTFTGLPCLYGHCGQMPMETSDKKAYLIAAADTLAAGEAHWTTHPFWPGLTVGAAPIMTLHGDTDDDMFPAWIDAHPSDIECVPIDVANGTDLSSLVVKATIIGR